MMEFKQAYIFEDETGIYFYRKTKKLKGYQYEATTISTVSRHRNVLCKTEMDAQEAVRIMRRDAKFT